MLTQVRQQKTYVNKKKKLQPILETGWHDVVTPVETTTEKQWKNNCHVGQK